MMRSLKGRLLVGMVAGMACLLVVFGVVIYTVVSRTLVNSFDASLAMAAKAIAGQVEQGKTGVEAESQDLRLPALVRRRRAYFFEMWLEDGRVFARSESLGGANLPSFAGPYDVPIFQPVTLPNGLAARAVSLTFSPRPSDEAQPPPEHPTRVLLVVAHGSDALDLQLWTLRWLLLSGAAGTTLVSLLVAAAVVGRGLQPLHTLARQIAGINTNHLQQRVAAKGMPSEMLPVAEKLNHLLSRLQEAFDRERCFTADVAHEMRTPLAGLRSTIEVSLYRSRSAAEYRDALAECLSIGSRMQSMVDSLLTLARLDAGQVQLNPDQVLVGDTVNACWQDYAAAASARGIVFENGLPPSLTCTTDRRLLLLILSNLLSNAAEYTNEAGRICIAVNGADPVRICFANTGCCLQVGPVPQVFDRFWRGDTSRTSTGGHCGLGLALAQRAVNVLGWHIDAAVESGGVFKVSLTLGLRNDRGEDQGET
jgi:two-component system, OmpR family, heavy metal sensor histidine kinase CusS